MAQEPARRLAAVWFADLVGHTQLAQRDEAAAARAASELHRIARTQCESRSGRLAETTGSAVLAVFDSVDQALQAAASTRDGFLASPDVAAPGVSLRVGLHVGEVAENDHGDVYGDAVDTASRIEPLADPGEVVISDVAYRLLRQRSTVLANDLGEHELEGIEEPLRLFAVTLQVSETGTSFREMLQEELSPLQLLDIESGGGMGDIYLARDPRLRRTMAVKVLKAELVRDQQARARFLREARVIAGLNHPNVIGIQSVGELEDDTPYFVMNFVEGGSYADRIRREGKLPPREGRRVLGDVASALEAAHAKGVVHRDIKAGNVLHDTDAGRAVVTDWGIAALDPTHEMQPDTRLTSTGAVIGSPQYMSPEQLAGDEVGPETDIYSFGLLAFELLAGTSPFDAETPRALLIAHLRDDARRLSEVLDDVDAELDALIARCLAKDPKERPTAHELARRLDPAGAAVLEWPPPGLEGIRAATVETLSIFAIGAVGLLVAPFAYSYGTAAPLGATAEMLIVFSFLFMAVSPFFVIAGCVATVLLARRVLRAARSGHLPGAILDAMADFRGDTGNLIAGTREYADLPPRTLRALRYARRTVLGLMVLMILLAIPSGFIMSAQVALGALPLVVTALAASLIRSGEHQVLFRRRRELIKKKASTPDLEGLVEPWYRTLALFSKGRALGSRRLSPSVWIGTALVATVALFPIVVLSPVVIASGLGLIMPEIFMNIAVEETDQRWASYQALESLRVPPDPEVTPQEAGELAWAVLWGSHEENRQERAGFRAPPEHLQAAVERLWSPNLLGPFGEGRTDARRLTDSLMLVASRGFTTEQRAWIEEINALPVIAMASEVAYASRVDLTGALHPVPEADSVYFVRPPSFLGLESIARRRLLAAALMFDDGRVTEAETALREVVSFGFLLMEQPVIGYGDRTILRTIELGWNGLAQIYDLTGRGAESVRVRAEIERLASRFEPSIPEGSFVRGWSMVRQLEHAWSEVRNESLSRSRRWEALVFYVPTMHCMNPDLILSGPAVHVPQLIEYARENLVRDESEAEMLRHIEEWDARAGYFMTGWTVPRDSGWLMGLARFSGRVLRNPRVEGCMRLGLAVAG